MELPKKYRRALMMFLPAFALLGCEESLEPAEPSELEEVDAAAMSELDSHSRERADPSVDAQVRLLIDANLERPDEDRAEPSADAEQDDDQPLGMLYGRVFALMSEHCASCHGAGKQLDLSEPKRAQRELVGVAAKYKACASDAGASKLRVIAHEPAASLLMEKLEGRQTCGKPMPTTALLASEQIEVFRAWIAAGAKLR